MEVIYHPIKYTSKLGRKIIYVFVSTASSVLSVIENHHLKKNQNKFIFFFFFWIVSVNNLIPFTTGGIYTISIN